MHVMDVEEKLVKSLDIISQKVRHHHDALWEEEKHYSWWVYIVLGALLWLFFSSMPHLHKLVGMLIGGGFGIWLSKAAYTVIRREGEYFYRYVHAEYEIARELRLERLIQPRPALRGRVEPNKPFCKLLEAFGKSHCTKLRLKIMARRKWPGNHRDNREVKELIETILRRKGLTLTIRDFFQMTFLVTMALYACLMAFAIVRFVAL